MTKSRKTLIAVLISILAVLLILAAVLSVYVVSLYNKVTYDPDASFAPNLVNEYLREAIDALNNGADINEVIQNPNLTAEQIDALKKYYEDIQNTVAGTDSPNIGDIISEVENGKTTNPITGENVMNILFLGTDERTAGEAARSDCMMIVSINMEKKQVTISSLMRDMYLKIEGLDKYNRINAAFQFGGVSMLKDTIRSYMGVEIDIYARVNFDSFQEIIDSIGGVDVELSSDSSVRALEIKHLEQYTDFSTSQIIEGTEYSYHLTGAQALRYCRDRYTGDGDFGRTERQRKILSSIVTKAQGMSFTELMAALPKILPLVTTDLTLGDCTKLLTSVATSYSSYKIQTFRIPADKTWKYATINGMEVLSVDYVTNRELWSELVYGENWRDLIQD